MVLHRCADLEYLPRGRRGVICYCCYAQYQTVRRDWWSLRMKWTRVERFHKEPLPLVAFVCAVALNFMAVAVVYLLTGPPPISMTWVVLPATSLLGLFVGYYVQDKFNVRRWAREDRYTYDDLAESERIVRDADVMWEFKDGESDG